MNIEILLGKTTEHLVLIEGTKHQVHYQMLHDFLKLQQSAKDQGFDMQIVSAFRDYQRQLKIWNAKANGERPILDDLEKPLEYSLLSPKEIVFAILRWSALPGCSRHHWGSDIDIFDANTQRLEEVKLIPSECSDFGPAARMHEWLDETINEKKAFGFFRPFKIDHGGVSPERWHLSYYPISRRILDIYTFSIFKNNIESSEIKFKEIILEHAEEIFHRFILNFDPP